MQSLKWFCFFFLLALLGCKKELTGAGETKSYIKAEIDGKSYSFNNISTEKDPSGNELLSFSSLSEDSISIGIKLAPTTPAYNTGTYLFRPGTITGIRFLNFTAEHNPDGIKINWVAEQQDETLDYYSVEKSEDGITFLKIASIPPNSPDPGGNSYQFIDSDYAITKYYYRIKAVLKDDKFLFTSVRYIFANSDYTAYYGERQKLFRGINGMIKITEHNRISRIVYGNFSFDAIVSPGTTKKIRNVSFKIIY